MDDPVGCLNVGCHNTSIVHLDHAVHNLNRDCLTSVSLSLSQREHVSSRNLPRDNVVKKHFLKRFFVIQERLKISSRDSSEGFIGRREDCKRPIAPQYGNKVSSGGCRQKGLKPARSLGNRYDVTFLTF